MISAQITISGKQHHLVVNQPMGMGGGFHVFLDMFYQGQIVMSLNRVGYALKSRFYPARECEKEDNGSSRKW